jgi:hypothetical protein
MESGQPMIRCNFKSFVWLITIEGESVFPNASIKASNICMLLRLFAIYTIGDGFFVECRLGLYGGLLGLYISYVTTFMKHYQIFIVVATYDIMTYREVS